MALSPDISTIASVCDFFLNISRTSQVLNEYHAINDLANIKSINFKLKHSFSAFELFEN